MKIGNTEQEIRLESFSGSLAFNIGAQRVYLEHKVCFPGIGPDALIPEITLISIFLDTLRFLCFCIIPAVICIQGSVIDTQPA